MVVPRGTSSKRTDANTLHLPRLLLSELRPQGGPLWTHTSAGDPQTLTGRSAQSRVGPLLLCSGCWVHKVCWCPPGVSVFPSPVEAL